MLRWSATITAAAAAVVLAVLAVQWLGPEAAPEPPGELNVVYAQPEAAGEGVMLASSVVLPGSEPSKQLALMSFLIAGIPIGTGFCQLA